MDYLIFTFNTENKDRIKEFELTLDDNDLPYIVMVNDCTEYLVPLNHIRDRHEREEWENWLESVYNELV